MSSIGFRKRTRPKLSEQIGQVVVPSVEPKVVHKITACTQDVKASITVVDQELAGDLALIFLMAGVSFEVRVIEQS